MILSDWHYHWKLEEFITEGADALLINPASVDIRIGNDMKLEVPDGWKEIDLTQFSEVNPFRFYPNMFALVSTYERISVPNGYALELRLKSSRAREGWDHALAFWVDPGWDGYLTMEIKNQTNWKILPIWRGMKFAQIIVHTLAESAIKPYSGRYQHAHYAENSKD